MGFVCGEKVVSPFTIREQRSIFHDIEEKYQNNLKIFSIFFKKVANF
jgi:hypothetical protein